MYEAAGALGSTWPETKDSKGIADHRQKMEKYAKAKGKEKQTGIDTAALEDLGEDAAEAAMSGSKGKEVEDLTGRMGKV